MVKKIGRLGGILANAGFESGDDLWLFTFGPQQNRVFSTTSTSYTNDVDQFNGNLVWDDMFPSDATTVVTGTTFVSPGSNETVDVRFRNTDDSETLMETTGITSNQTVSLDPTTYTPTTTSGETTYRLEVRTDDGSNSSSIDTPYLFVGMGL